MSVPEVLYRGRKAARTELQRFGFSTAANAAAPRITHVAPSWGIEVANVVASKYVAAAERLYCGQYDLFARQSLDIGREPRWNKDPCTGIEPTMGFGKKLDYRDEALVGNIKYLWELNRHLHLVTLAQAYKLTGESHYLTTIRQQLTGWFDQCSYLMGPNWASSLELAIRLINWAFVWMLIGGVESVLFVGSVGTLFRDRWLRSIYQHTHFIAGHLSRYSSANNHLIGEAAGLFVAGSVWPFWKQMDSWKARGYRALVEEALKQNGTDGVNLEQSTSYQQFALDLLMIPAIVGRTSGVEFPKSYWARIEAMLEYLSAIMDAGGNVPMIGDADDGYAVKLSQEKNFSPFRSLLATGAIIFSRGDFKAKAVGLDDKSRWLLGPDADKRYNELRHGPARLPARQAFPEGGYYILGSDFETATEIRLVVDAGPLGYESIAAHGHADALAFTLSVGGREILVDPGTYAYHTDTGWRNYFRGTAAHNTVLIDDEDQSVIGGNFMWLRHANARCELWHPGEFEDRFRGTHDGYLRYPDPVTHRREIRLEKNTRRIHIMDEIECKLRHRIGRFWHFSENCHVRCERDHVVVVNNGITVTLTSQDMGVKITHFQGDHYRPAGWISRRFDEKRPTSSVALNSTNVGHTILTATIDC